MGEQGKTTCVRLLYNNEVIVSHFDVRAWYIISQTYNWRELLRYIFSQVTGFKIKVDEVGKLADMLQKRLLGKRYFIALDDMWDGFMQNVKSGRLEEVAEDQKIHNVRIYYGRVEDYGVEMSGDREVFNLQKIILCTAVNGPGGRRTASTRTRPLKWNPWFVPEEETSIAVAWISFPDLPPNLFAREAVSHWLLQLENH
ncbi:hypothetical protein MTR67_040854 [Solanum verrucosum]|uniref:NB-ARC domain-containing protein n=1 Tax=Solanum verrucosum TaxID=315347 RepID=A0AAF0UKB9_SOLVR|nr:hypothetical protein MTR67_040854 [Solanum verrucosum]